VSGSFSCAEWVAFLRAGALPGRMHALNVDDRDLPGGFLLAGDVLLGRAGGGVVLVLLWGVLPAEEGQADDQGKPGEPRTSATSGLNDDGGLAGGGGGGRHADFLMTIATFVEEFKLTVEGER